jgi:hypothetical protein
MADPMICVLQKQTKTCVRACVFWNEEWKYEINDYNNIWGKKSKLILKKAGDSLKHLTIDFDKW